MLRRTVLAIMPVLSLVACDREADRRHELAAITAKQCDDARQSVIEHEATMAALGKPTKDDLGRTIRDEACKLAKQAADLERQPTS
jgi:hypothetical protein